MGGGHLQQGYGDFLTVQESIWLNSTKQIFKVDRREIHFLRFTLESYDGMALVSTIDPYVALIEVSMAPGCETEDDYKSTKDSDEYWAKKSSKHAKGSVAAE